MTTKQWDQLTPAHQAEIWPSLSDADRTEILNEHPDTLKTIAKNAADLIQAPRDIPAHVAPFFESIKRVPPPKAPPLATDESRPLSATICYVFAVLTMLGAVALFFLELSNAAPALAIYGALGCFAGAVVWWVLADIATGVHRMARR